MCVRLSLPARWLAPYHLFLCRQYLDEHLVELAKANPQIEIAVSVKDGRHPWVRGYYLRDRDKTLSLRNLSASQIIERVGFLRDTRSINMYKNAKAFRTTPSIQGEWEMGQQLEQPHKTIRA